MLRLLFTAVALTALGFAPAPVPRPNKAADTAAAARRAALAQLSGVWVQISVRYSGEEMFDAPITGHWMKFDGKNLSEFTCSGRRFLTGEVTIVEAEEGIIRIDLPRKVIVAGRMQAVTVPAIARVEKGRRVQIAYFDPRGGVPNRKRPGGFDSTAANKVVLITLVPKP